MGVLIPDCGSPAGPTGSKHWWHQPFSETVWGAILLCMMVTLSTNGVWACTSGECLDDCCVGDSSATVCSCTCIEAAKTVTDGPTVECVACTVLETDGCHGCSHTRLWEPCRGLLAAATSRSGLGFLLESSWHSWAMQACRQPFGSADNLKLLQCCVTWHLV